MVVLVGNGQGWPHPGWRLIKGPPFHLAVVLLLWGQSRSVALLRPFKPILYKKQTGTQREKKHVLTLTLMLVRRKSACKTSARSSKILRWLTPLLGPNLDPKTGPKQRPKRRNENVIQFWTPFWGPYLDPKMGSAIGEFRCCPHMLCKQICDPAA